MCSAHQVHHSCHGLNPHTGPEDTQLSNDKPRILTKVKYAPHLLVFWGTELRAFALSYTILSTCLRQHLAKLLHCTAGLKLVILLPQPPRVLGLQACATVPSSYQCFAPVLKTLGPQDLLPS